MPIITTPLGRNDSGPAVADLQTALLKLGSPIADAEKDAKTFGDSTLAAVIALRKRFGLPEANGNPPFDASVGRLLNVAVAAEDGNGMETRKAVRESLAAANGAQPQEFYFLAHYGIFALDYVSANRAAKLAPELDGIVTTIEPIISVPPPWPTQPEVKHPENFYTYRRPFIDPAAVERVASDWANLTPADMNPLQRDGGPHAIAALRTWYEGKQQFAHRRYDLAVSAYDACQDAVLGYFDKFYLDITVPAGTRSDRLKALVRSLYLLRGKRVAFWESIRGRRESISLAELQARDTISGIAYDSAINFVWKQLGNSSVEPDPIQNFRETNLDAPLVILAFVLAPLARAEANRQRRQYDAAVADLQWVLTPILVGRGGVPGPGDPIPEPVYARLACEFIELPFARLLLAETMLDKADSEYKARIPAEPPPAPDASRFQNLKAAQSYLEMVELFRNEGEYVSRVETARNQLDRQIKQRLSQNDTRSPAFQTLGKQVGIPTISAVNPQALPGLDRHAGPHEPILKFRPPGGQTVMRETNPRVYAALLTAQARLEQLRAQFNYLGYSDDYVPPWRFQFLLERARYFAEHAKNAQRDYLNFLNNAEHEEFQELSAAQGVELEKSNVRIETARVDQVRLEVQAAFESKTLAEDVSENAVKRFEDYLEMDEKIREKESASLLGSVLGGALSLGIGIFTGNIPMAIGGLEAITVGAASEGARGSIAQLQREHEKLNLQLAGLEAHQSAVVAQAQLAVVQAGLLVAGLQRQAALLRHEFAVENLSFLRTRTLSSEQWYRLAATIRSVSDTYLRYAIELAFLAEQAYEFEADKIINVIRFDYDQSETGDFLAADFLLRDLDTLEQDLIVNQRQRQQQVRYVLSMAREFPDTLQELRDNGRTTFSLVLEQIERRFPGLYNVRIGAVDVLPVALMDSTRFSLELSYLGSSQVRLKAPPGSEETWVKQIRVRGPETTVFSGLTRQDASAVFPFAAGGQRNAFEGLGAASAWQIDMSMKENQVVPGSLANMLITFTLSGYHDSDLRALVEQGSRRTVLTSWLSAQQSFPDAFYDFNRTGRMEWRVSHDLLTLTDSIGALRNAGVMLIPARKQAQFGRLTNSYRIDFRVPAAGNLEILSDIPQLKFEAVAPIDSLKVKAKATLPAGAALSWDFGDGSGLQSGATLQHTYAKPGKYEVTLRVVRDAHLSEYKADVVVSRTHRAGLPVTAFPSLSLDPDTTGLEPGRTRIAAVMTAPADDLVTGIWKLDDELSHRGDRVSFDLMPGDYTLEFRAIRTLQARVYSKRRFAPDQALSMELLTLTSNRRFDAAGQETTGVSPNPPANPFTQHLFTGGALSPVDDWVIELPLAQNPWLRAASLNGQKEYDLGDVQDAILALEYEASLS